MKLTVSQCQDVKLRVMSFCLFKLIKKAVFGAELYFASKKKVIVIPGNVSSCDSIMWRGLSKFSNIQNDSTAATSMPGQSLMLYSGFGVAVIKFLMRFVTVLYFMVACRHVALPCHQRNMDHCHCLTVRSGNSQIKTLHVFFLPLHFLGPLPCSRVNRSLIHSLCLHNWQKWKKCFFFLCYFIRRKKNPGKDFFILLWVTSFHWVWMLNGPRLSLSHPPS